MIQRKPGAYVRDPMKYKTQLCTNFMTRGKCAYNKKCQFAHGEEELNPKREICPTVQDVAMPPMPPMPPMPLTPPPPAAAMAFQLLERPPLPPSPLVPHQQVPAVQQYQPPLPPAQLQPMRPMASQPRPQPTVAMPPRPPTALWAPTTFSDAPRRAPEAGPSSAPQCAPCESDSPVPCRRETSFMTESVLKQLEFLFDEPLSPGAFRTNSSSIGSRTLSPISAHRVRVAARAA